VDVGSHGNAWMALDVISFVIGWATVIASRPKFERRYSELLSFPNRRLFTFRIVARANRWESQN